MFNQFKLVFIFCVLLLAGCGSISPSSNVDYSVNTQSNTNQLEANVNLIQENVNIILADVNTNSNVNIQKGSQLDDLANIYKNRNTKLK